MKKYSPFSFRGCGYVQDLELNEAVAKLRIDVMSITPHDSSSQITLECQILPQMREKIRQLDRDCPVTEGVMMGFEVVFKRFVAHFVDIASKTPQDLVLLKGELKAISSWQHDSTGTYPLR